jgi:hypothetical protein
VPAFAAATPFSSIVEFTGTVCCWLAGPRAASICAEVSELPLAAPRFSLSSPPRLQAASINVVPSSKMRNAILSFLQINTRSPADVPA